MTIRSWLDFKYAWRKMFTELRFSLAAILIMTMGLGLCIFTYSLAYGTYLKAAPFENGKRLYFVDEKYGKDCMLDIDDFYTLQDAVKDDFEVFDFYQFARVNISGYDTPKVAYARRVNPEFFRVSQAQPHIGRLIEPQDVIADAPLRAVVSYDFWVEYFHADKSIVGKQFMFNTLETEVVGVTQPGYAFPSRVDIWVATNIYSEDLESRMVHAYGLLKTEVTHENAQRRVKRALMALNNDDVDYSKARLTKIQDYLIGDNGFLIVLGMVSLFIMLLALINVASFLLMRLDKRNREITIKLALGASRFRLLTQLIWDSFLICLIGFIFAILLAQIALDFTYQKMFYMAQGQLPYFWSFDVNGHILVVSLLFTFVVALVTGGYPAIKIIRLQRKNQLNLGRVDARKGGKRRAQKAFIATEVAITSGLLAAITFLLMGYFDAVDVDTGIDSKDWHLALVEVHDANYNDRHAKTAFFQSLYTQLATSNQFEGVAMLHPLPGWTHHTMPFEYQGVSKPQMVEKGRVYRLEAMPGSLAALDIKLQQGRYFTREDGIDAAPVAIVTQSFIDLYLPENTSPLGEKILIKQNGPSEWIQTPRWTTIVGVVDHFLMGGPFKPMSDTPAVVIPMPQDQKWMAYALLKSDKPQEHVGNILTHQMAKVDNRVPYERLLTFDEAQESVTRFLRFISQIMAIFAVITLFFSASGMFTMLSSMIAKRTQEIGIRTALGATQADILLMFLKMGVKELVKGLAIGAVLIYFILKMMITEFLPDNEFIGIEYEFPFWQIYIVITGLVSLIIGFIMVSAIYFTSKQITKMEPTKAIRYE